MNMYFVCVQRLYLLAMWTCTTWGTTLHCYCVVDLVAPVVPLCHLLEIDIVMSSLLFMLITYYSIMTDTNECD